jgi:mono/diheme cytochrome c family protein
MKKFLGVFCLILAIIGCQQPPKNAGQTPQPTVVEKKIDPVKRGEYLVKAGACNECHTPERTGTGYDTNVIRAS